jgi:uncharacterized protein YbjT (DUF2867 family)
MQVLVTGGTGRLGRAIVANLKREGHCVRVLARCAARSPRSATRGFGVAEQQRVCTLRARCGK